MGGRHRARLHPLPRRVRVHRRLPSPVPGAWQHRCAGAAGHGRAGHAAVRAAVRPRRRARARPLRGLGPGRLAGGDRRLPVRRRHATRWRLRIGDPVRCRRWRCPHRGDAVLLLRRVVLGQPAHDLLAGPSRARRGGDRARARLGHRHAAATRAARWPAARAAADARCPVRGEASRHALACHRRTLEPVDRCRGAGTAGAGDPAARRAPVDHHLGLYAVGRQGRGAARLGSGRQCVLDRAVPERGPRRQPVPRHHLGDEPGHRARCRRRCRPGRAFRAEPEDRFATAGRRGPRRPAARLRGTHRLRLQHRRVLLRHRLGQPARLAVDRLRAARKLGWGEAAPPLRTGRQNGRLARLGSAPETAPARTRT